MTCYPTEIGGLHGITTDLEPCYVSLLGLLQDFWVFLLALAMGLI